MTALLPCFPLVLYGICSRDSVHVMTGKVNQFFCSIVIRMVLSRNVLWTGIHTAPTKDANTNGVKEKKLVPLVERHFLALLKGIGHF